MIHEVYQGNNRWYDYESTGKNEAGEVLCTKYDQIDTLVKVVDTSN